MRRSVRAVSVARAELLQVPTTLADAPSLPWLHPALTNTRSCLGQFPMRYLVWLVWHFGCILDFMSRSCSCARAMAGVSTVLGKEVARPAGIEPAAPRLGERTE